MAPPFATDDGGDGGRHKHSRKIKRLRDASCMRKRETKQDRWGRQRGGRKARWDKLNRHPSAWKSSRLRSSNAVGGVDVHLDEEAFGIIDAAVVESPTGLGNHTVAGSLDSGVNTFTELDFGHYAAISRQAIEDDVDGHPKTNVENKSLADARTPVARSKCVLHTVKTPPASQQLRDVHSGVGGPPATHNSGGGGSAHRSALRSPRGGGGLGVAGRGGRSHARVSSLSGLGSYRGSPPPLHRRLSSPAGATERLGTGLKHGRSAQKGTTLSRLRAVKSADAGAIEDEVKRATPPPPPSLFESVFKDKLPSLTPRKMLPATPRLSRDSIVHAIFQSLFGKRKIRSGPRERYGGDWDDVEDDNECTQGEEEVDESWIKTGISLSLFSSQALDFACRSTAGADILHEYVDENAVFRLVTDLRFEDPRVPSPRLIIVKAIYENCAHLRLPTLRAMAHATHDHLMRARELESWAARVGIDVAESPAAAVAGTTKLGLGDRSVAGAATGKLKPAGSLSAVGAGSVQVTGRDQSQTLAELLLFVLETFPKFFLGSVGAGDAHQVMPVDVNLRDDAGHVAFTRDIDAERTGSSSSGGGCDRHPESSETHRTAEACRGEKEPAESVVAAPTSDPHIGEPNQSSSPSATPRGRRAVTRSYVQGKPSDDREGPDDGGGCDLESVIDEASSSQGRVLGESDATCEPARTPDLTKGQKQGPRDSPSSTDARSPRAWPSLQASASSVEEVEDQAPFSPAWATAAVRSLEVAPEAESRGNGRCSSSSSSSSEDGLDGRPERGHNSVWGTGLASQDLVWEHGPDAGSDCEGTVGPARVLRFAEENGESMGVESVVSFPAKREDMRDVAVISGQTLPVDERVASARGAASTPSDGWPGSSLVEPWKDGQHEVQPTGAAGVGYGESCRWPDEALKEAARSLCNLYVSHGAPAAGGEAAATADAPERLQPLGAAGATLCSLWPQAAVILLRRLLGTWPSGSSRREVAYLRLIAGIACAAPPLEAVAQEAVYLVQADFILMVYLAPDRRLMDLVTTALCANRGHWSADVRTASDQAFDLMLDFL